MVLICPAMGCIQSKSVSRPGRAASKTKVVSNGTQNKQENYSAKTNDNNFDLHLRSPRNEESTSGMTNGNLGSGSIHFAEDLEPVSSLPDTMTICTVSSDRHGALSVSNVNIKQRGSAHSSRVQSSKSRDDDLSIEELDTELDDFSKLRLVYERPVRPKSESHIVRNKTFVVSNGKNGFRPLRRPTSERIKPTSIMNV